MDSTTLTRQMKLQQWTELIHMRIESGMTVSNWCEKNAINPAKYYYWLKRVRQNSCDNLPIVQQQTTNIVPIAIHETLVTNTLEQDHSYTMRISSNGFTLEFSNNASSQLIENSLKVISNVR